MKEYQFEKLEGKKTLIIGEVGSGKTRLTASLLREFIEQNGPDEITMLDFSPSQLNLGRVRVGGRVKDFFPDLYCHAYESSSSIRAPRLEGKDADDVRTLAEHNASITSGLIGRYLLSPTSHLFINDLTIHLHAGDFDLLLKALRKSKTFVGNAYNGSSLLPDYGSGISKRERDLLRRIIMEVDILIELQKERITKEEAS